ncbi:MAG: ADP-ribosylglycohydrolase family protein [Chloroflexaceae bacterium]|jgi:ADP-ribosylglycohydrolase|nr:ADP-ribosylglycohydrolase family protein [Chloroflexaceae bacterium]
MIGAIAGDVIGSVYEHKKRWMGERNPDFEPLFAPNSRFTDDTVLTLAVAEHLLHGDDLAELFKIAFHRYPTAGFGSRFRAWAKDEAEDSYGSWGNGAAMRVSPVAYTNPTLAEVLHHAKRTAIVTHSHPEGVKGALAIAAATFLARTGSSKGAIAAHIERTYAYDLNTTIDEIRPSYEFDSSAQGTVPQAIIAFLDSNDYESAVRLAVSLGGDADTLACMAGSIAEAFYGGVPPAIRQQALERLDDSMLEIIAAFEERFHEAWPQTER